LRVAYLSADFRDHAVAYLTAELYELHDRSRFDVFGVSFGVDDAREMRKRLAAAFDEFHDVRGTSDQEVAKLLYDLQVDIAIDLMGHTAESRPGIFAHRPAPIQASYLGYPGTMGTPFIDYIIADKVVAPFEQQQFYTEKIVHLPDCYQVNDSKRKIAENAPTRRELGLPERAFVFCCFNNNWKLTPAIFEGWMRLLDQVEGSVLWLFRDNESAERNLREEARRRGIDPSRLVFATRLSPDAHLARHRLADLFLDTLPYNGHTTASDALWAGLPVLTRKGEAFAGRVAASLLHAVGIPELITSNIEDYQALALKLAREPELLAGIKAKLAARRNTYPLFDTVRFTRHVEAAYTTMWETWRRGEAPKSFSVEPIEIGGARPALASRMPPRNDNGSRVRIFWRRAVSNRLLCSRCQQKQSGKQRPLIRRDGNGYHDRTCGAGLQKPNDDTCGEGDIVNEGADSGASVIAFSRGVALLSIETACERNQRHEKSAISCYPPRITGHHGYSDGRRIEKSRVDGAEMQP